jgi:hypothetical protein
VKQHRLGGFGSLVMWLGLASAAAAAEVSLTVSTPSALAEGGMAQTRLRVGTVAGATSGFDTQWDVPAPPIPSSSLVTLAAGIVAPSLLPDRQNLLWDFREEVFPQTWTIEVTSDQTAPVSLNWQTTASGNACVPIEWTLEDAFSGTRVGLNASSSDSYQYAGSNPRTRRFIVTADAPLAQEAPPVPGNLWSPRQGRGSVYLAWSGSGSAVRYHVYRNTGDGDIRLTPVPIATTSYVDTGVDRSKRSIYRIRAVKESGCESEFSGALTVAPHR